jgi:hypothetical protein
MIATPTVRWIALLLAVLCHATISAQPVNDTFSSASTLTGLPVSTNATNVGASMEPGEPLPAEFATGSVWFSWTAPASTTVSISTHGSDFDTILAVWTGDSLPELAAVASNDDDAELGTDENPFFQSRVRVDVEAGTTYRIAVYGFDGAVGAITLALAADPGQPANDSFFAPATATGLPAGLSGSNVNASLQTAEPTPAENATGSAWFEWTSPVTDTIRIDTYGSDFDTMLAVWTGTRHANLVLVADNDDSESLAQSRVWINAVQGTTYRIAVYGFSGASGAITLNISEDTGASISGTVTSQVNSSPLKDIQVTAYQWTTLGGDGFWNPASSTLTAADGTYVLRGLAAGTYRVEFIDTNGNFFTRYHANAPDLASATDLIVSGFSAISGIDAALAPDSGRRITGTVTNAGGFIPLQGIRVTAYQSFSDEPGGGNAAWIPVSSVSTASDGTYTIRDLQPGAYRVGFLDLLGNFVSSYYLAAPNLETASDVAVNESTATSGINASLDSASTQPANDDFFEPSIVSGFPASVSSTNIGATLQPGESLPQPDATRSIWFSWEAPVTAPVTIDTFGSDFDTVLAVWTGSSFSALNLIAANDDAGDGLQSRLRLNVIEGTIYRIAVYGVDGAAGAVSLNITPDLSSRISGTITGPDGTTPLATIEVTAYQAFAEWDEILQEWTTLWLPVAFTESGADGSYTLADLTEGSYRVGFNDPAGTYLPGFHLNAASLESANEIAVPLATNVTGINASLSQPGSDEGPGELTLTRTGPGSFSLVFTGTANRQYQLQESDDLAGWTDVGPPFTAEPGGNSLLRESAEPRMFWRVKRIP